MVPKYIKYPRKRALHQKRPATSATSFQKLGLMMSPMASKGPSKWVRSVQVSTCTILWQYSMQPLPLQVDQNAGSQMYMWFVTAQTSTLLESPKDGAMSGKHIGGCTQCHHDATSHHCRPSSKRSRGASQRKMDL